MSALFDTYDRQGNDGRERQDTKNYKNCLLQNNMKQITYEIYYWRRFRDFGIVTKSKTVRPSIGI